MTKVVIAPPAYRVVKTSTGYKLVTAATQGPPGAGRIPGGSAAQVLRKASGADYDVEWHSLAKADVGLGNVDNTSDVDKPVSTAQAAAIALAIAQLVGGAGPAYDTLVELQNIILADETAASALAALVATKVAKAGDTMTGSLLATDGVPDLGDATHRFRDLNLSRYLVLGGMLIPTAVYDGTTLQINAPTGKTINLGVNSGWGLSYKTGGACVNASDYIGWGGSSVPDTQLSRPSAGVVSVDGATKGDALGALKFAKATIVTPTLLTSSPAVDVTVNVNDAAVTFTGVKYNLTGPSASASAVADFQAGGSSVLKVRKDGTLIFGGAWEIFAGGTPTRIQLGAVSNSKFAVNATGPYAVGQIGLSTAPDVAPDIALSRISAGIAALGTGSGDGSAYLRVNGLQLANGAAMEFTANGGADLRIKINGEHTHGFRNNTSQKVFAVVAGGVFGWTASTTNPTSADPDTAFSRVSAGKVALGTGAAGNNGGTLQLTTVEYASGGTVSSTTAGLGITGFTGGMVLNVGNFGAGLLAARFASTGVLQWDAASATNNTPDTGISRISAGLLGLGTGAQGAVDGKLRLNEIQFGSASNTLSPSGFTTTSSNPVLTGGGNGFLLDGGFTTQARSAGLVQKSTGIIAWTSATAYADAPDVALSRSAAGRVALGTGAAANDDGQLWLAGVRLKPRTVSALPTATAGLAGLEMVVSDASAPAYRAALSAGGGSDVVGARCTGSDWRAC